MQPLPDGRGSDSSLQCPSQSRDREGAVAGQVTVIPKWRVPIGLKDIVRTFHAAQSILVLTFDNLSTKDINVRYSLSLARCEQSAEKVDNHSFLTSLGG